jgi:ABC-type transporter Mla subunit MlaD
MNDAHRERLILRVGAIVLLVLVAGVGSTVGLEGRHLLPGFRVHVEMERSGALQEGSPVRLAGRTIGEIQGIRTGPGGVIVDLWIRNTWRQHLRRNSEFFMNQATIFSEAYLEVGPPPRGAEPGLELTDGAVVRGVAPPPLDRLALKAYDNLQAVTALLREGLPEARELGRALDELDGTLREVEPSPGAYGRTAAAAGRALGEGRLLHQGLEEGGVTLERLQRTAAEAATFFERARRDLAVLRVRLDRLAGHVDRLSARFTPDRIAQVVALFERTRQLLRQVDHLIADSQAMIAVVASGEGSVGAFLDDQEIADDLKQLMKVMKTRPWETLGHP